MAVWGIVHGADNNKRDKLGQHGAGESYFITRALTLSSKPWWAAW